MKYLWHRFFKWTNKEPNELLLWIDGVGYAPISKRRLIYPAYTPPLVTLRNR